MCEDITKYMGDFFSVDTDGVVVSSKVPVVLIASGSGFSNFKIEKKIKRVKCKFYIVGSYDTEINQRSLRIASNWFGDKAVELGGNAVIEFAAEKLENSDDPVDDFNHTRSGDHIYSGLIILVKAKPFKKWKVKKKKNKD